MTQEERQELIQEKRVLFDRIENDMFADPRALRRIEAINSLLLTDGKSESVRIVQVKKGSRAGTKGLNAKKTYYRKGPVG